MDKLTIREIEEQLFKQNDPDNQFIQSLQKDKRKGVQNLLKKWQARKDRENKLYEKHFQMTHFERKLRGEGFRYIAGIDEAGRGPLAGPVVAAAVILPDDFYLPGLDDSKKLSEHKRNSFFEIIKAEALAINIGVSSVEEIDCINIFEAAKNAMLTAAAGLEIQPDILLIDAIKLPAPYSQVSIIKGDAKSISIAAASIIAKVTRDRIMIDIDKEYPQYQFSKNMGYGTKSHLNAIKQFGVTPYHRQSFSPVKEYVSRGL